MPKVSLSDVASGYNLSTRVNANNDLIEAGFDNTLSRDGTAPNAMGASLDMNSNRIINVGSPVNPTDAVRYSDLTSLVTVSTALPSQTGNSGKYITTNGSSLAFDYPPVYIPQTPEELAAGVTPSNTAYAPGDIRRYGAVRNSTVGADMTATTTAWSRALSTGHDVYIPVGTWNVNSTTTITGAAGWSRKIYGADKASAVLKANGAGVTILKIESDLPVVKMDNFSMQGATGTGHGLWCTLTPFQCSFSNMWLYMGGKGIYMPNGGGSYGPGFSLNFYNVDFSSVDDHGIELWGGPAVCFFGCYGHDFPSGKAAWRIYQEAKFFGCNGVDNADYWIIAGQTTSGGLDAANTAFRNLLFIGCNFENWNTIAFNGRYIGSAIFHTCTFVPKNGAYTTTIDCDQWSNCVIENCGWIPLNGAPSVGSDWEANKFYRVGAYVENNNRQLVCVTAGTSGGAFSSTTGAGQTDGTCVWDYAGVGSSRTAASEITCDVNTPVTLRGTPSLGKQPKVYHGGFLRETPSDYTEQLAFLVDGAVHSNVRVTGMAKFAQEVGTRTAITYSASMTPDAMFGNSFYINATNGSAFTINNISNGASGQTAKFTIANTSGGALGAVTWAGGYKLAAWTSPATGFSRSITFEFDGTNWIEISRTASDVPN